MEKLSGTFYKMSRKDNSHMIGVLVEIDGNPRKGIIYERLCEIVNKYPLLKSIPREKTGWIQSDYHWEEIPINISHHFTYKERRRYDKGNLRHFINRIMNASFNPEIPEWRCYYLTYKKSKKSFILWKCNHIYGDGFLMSQYMKHFADNCTFKYPSRKKRSPSLFKKIYALIYSIFSLLYFLLFYRKSKIIIDLPSAKRDKVCFYKCKQWKLDEVKKLKNRYGVTINDLLYTILLKSLQRYSSSLSASLSSLTIFNLRNYTQDYVKIEAQENNIGFISLSHNMKEETIHELLQNNHKKMSYYKSSLIAPLIAWVLRHLYSLSPQLVVQIMEYITDKSTFGISNFQTFSDEQTIQGFPITNISNMVYPYRLGSLFTIVSYGNNITLNMMYRKRNFADPKKFIECLEKTYDELLK